mmetsp:Transcript_18491/g.38441  ORF Transcript_18491/g.38441 Transcript_18491/m.38441 type:complete len:176 (-) Transcript_18491:184-711(-)
MGQGLNPLNTCESVRHDDKRLRVNEMRYAADKGGLAVHDLLATCGDVNGLVDADMPPKRRGANRPLLKHKRPPRGDEGITALMVAAQFGSLQRVDRLIAERANVNATDARGYTPLHWAAQEGHPEACLALLLGGADAGAATADGQTPLQLAEAEDPETAAKMSDFLQQRASKEGS